MNGPPPLFRDQRTTDAEHLKLLSVFHFVGAGLAVVGIVFLLLHFMAFRTLFANPEMWQGGKTAGPPPEVFGIFKWFYLLGALWCIASGVLNVLSGCFIRSRRNRTTSLVVAGINCLHMPLGTILGIFTIIVLSRESVRELYDEAQGRDGGF